MNIIINFEDEKLERFLKNTSHTFAVKYSQNMILQAFSTDYFQAAILKYTENISISNIRELIKNENKLLILLLSKDKYQSEFIRELYNIGIYHVVFLGKQQSYVEQIEAILEQKRTRKQAREYYGLTFPIPPLIQEKFSMENENDVNLVMEFLADKTQGDISERWELIQRKIDKKAIETLALSLPSELTKALEQVPSFAELTKKKFLKTPVANYKKYPLLKEHKYIENIIKGVFVTINRLETKKADLLLENITKKGRMTENKSEDIQTNNGRLEHISFTIKMESNEKIIGKKQEKQVDQTYHQQETTINDVSQEKERVSDLPQEKKEKNCEIDGHDYAELFIFLKPSCKNQGIEKRACKRCGHTEITKTLPKEEHCYSEWQVIEEATCICDGKKKQTCIHCGYEKQEPIPKQDHQHIEEIGKEATCIEDGYMQKKCSVCNHIEITEKLPALGHSFDEWNIIKEATCTKTGKKEKICAICGETITEVIPKKEHNFAEWVILQNATCEKEGKRGRICNSCNYSESESIPKIDHQYIEEVGKEATCMEEGYLQKRCTVCNHTEIGDKIPKTNHEFGDWRVEKEPSCTKEGSQKRICIHCGEVEITPLERIDHQYNEEIGKEATCIEDGYMQKKCSVCDHIEISEKLPALGHTFNEWEVEKEATCFEDGIKKRSCIHCATEIIETIPKLEHQYIDEIGREATDTEGGYLQKRCTLCNHIEITERIPALDNRNTISIEKTVGQDNDIGEEVSKETFKEAFSRLEDTEDTKNQKEVEIQQIKETIVETTKEIKSNFYDVDDNRSRELEEAIEYYFGDKSEEDYIEETKKELEELGIIQHKKKKGKGRLLLLIGIASISIITCSIVIIGFSGNKQKDSYNTKITNYSRYQPLSSTPISSETDSSKTDNSKQQQSESQVVKETSTSEEETSESTEMESGSEVEESNQEESSQEVEIENQQQVVPSTQPQTTVPVETQPQTTAPVQTQTKPVETQPQTTTPVQTQTKPVETQPQTTAPVQTQPIANKDYSSMVGNIFNGTEVKSFIESNSDTLVLVIIRGKGSYVYNGSSNRGIATTDLSLINTTSSHSCNISETNSTTMVVFVEF